VDKGLTTIDVAVVLGHAVFEKPAQTAASTDPNTAVSIFKQYAHTITHQTVASSESLDNSIRHVRRGS
jgi:hypothetical protein